MNEDVQYLFPIEKKAIFQLAMLVFGSVAAHRSRVYRVNQPFNMGNGLGEPAKTLRPCVQLKKSPMEK